MSVSVFPACKQMRTRDEFIGTVGGTMARTTKPRACRNEARTFALTVCREKIGDFGHSAGI